MARWNTLLRKWRLIAALIIAVVAAVLLVSYLTRCRPAGEKFAAFFATDWEQVEAGTVVLLDHSRGRRCALYETPRDLERLRAAGKAYFCLLRGAVNGGLHYPAILVEMTGLPELAEDPVYEISWEEYEALGGAERMILPWGRTAVQSFLYFCAAV